MSIITKQTSQETLVEALELHGWTFTVEPATVRVPDEEKDYSSRYSTRRRLGRKDAPGFRVSATNGAVAQDGLRDIGTSVSFDAYFTENGSYLAELTSGGYPVYKSTPLRKVLEVVAEKAPAEIERRRNLRQEQNEQSAAEKIIKADAQVAEKIAECEAAQGPALEAVMTITGLPEHIARSVLDALVGERGLPISVFAGALATVNRAHEIAANARTDYQRSEQNGWIW